MCQYPVSLVHKESLARRFHPGPTRLLPLKARSGGDSACLSHRGFLSPGEIVFTHIVPFAKPSRRMSTVTPSNSTLSSSIIALALRGQPAIAANLLIVPEAEAFGDLLLLAITSTTGTSPTPILSLGRQASVQADLLIMLGTISRCSRYGDAVRCATFLYCIFHPEIDHAKLLEECAPVSSRRQLVESLRSPQIKQSQCQPETAGTIQKTNTYNASYISS